jgi:hypothetical protein
MNISLSEGSQVKAVNLATLEEVLFVGVAPEFAVMSAHACETHTISEFAKFYYGKTLHTEEDLKSHGLIRGKHTVACGDWAAKSNG